MKTIEVSRDIAEALEKQFYPAIKENFEDEDSCEAISIGGVIKDERDIDYLEIEDFLLSNWGYSQKDVDGILQSIINKFRSETEPFEVLWVA